MGIYDQNGSDGFSLPDIPIQKTLLVALAVAIILGIIFFSYQTIFTTKAISANFAQETWQLAPNDSMLLAVSITNNQNEIVRESTVRVRPLDFDSINVFPPSQTINTIESGNNRNISFVLRTNKPFDKFVSGTYSFTIEWIINDKIIEQKTVSIPITKSNA